MALTRIQKEEQVAALQKRIEKCKSVVFVTFNGLSVSAMGEYRGKLLEKGAEIKVGKKTLFAIAAKNVGFPEVPEEILTGAVGFVFSFEDELSGAKASLEFGKQNSVVQIIGGVLNGKVLSKSEAVELAKILSRQELLGKFLSLINSPLGSFASMCSNPLASFARGVKQIADKQSANS